jgi:hypothetical protein
MFLEFICSNIPLVLLEVHVFDSRYGCHEDKDIPCVLASRSSL